MAEPLVIRQSERVAQEPEHAHLLNVVEALVAAGNTAAHGGFTPNQGGWDCEMTRPIDFDVVRAALMNENRDVRLDTDHGRLDCMHCWSGIYGPTDLPDLTCRSEVPLARGSPSALCSSGERADQPVRLAGDAHEPAIGVSFRAQELEQRRQRPSRMPSQCARPFLVALMMIGLSCSNGESRSDTDETSSSMRADLKPIGVRHFEVMGERGLQLTLDYCGRDYRMEVQETSERVEVLIQAPLPGDAATESCAALAAVILDEPLGDRRVANTGTGRAISQVNAE